MGDRDGGIGAGIGGGRIAEDEELALVALSEGIFGDAVIRQRVIVGADLDVTRINHFINVMSKCKL